MRQRAPSTGRTERTGLPAGIARERETCGDDTRRPANVSAHTTFFKAQRGTHTTDHRRARERRGNAGLRPAGGRNCRVGPRNLAQRTTLFTAPATQVQQVPSVPSVLISDPSVEITTFWSCSASPDFTYHSQRAPSGSVTQVSVFSA